MIPKEKEQLALAALAILGQRSAHSFPIGPVIAEPFISPLGFTLHTDTSIIFKIHENTILSAPRLTLPNNDSRHNLLPEIRLPLLDSGHYHITNAGRRQAVQATLNSLHRYDVKIMQGEY
jgi:hypothetical protein